jgi:two-component system response regulator
MKNKSILLVEDNPRDEALTMRALKKTGIASEIIVARDGVEALDYLFGTGVYEGRDTSILPQLVMLDLKLPKMDGLQVLQRLRADERTKRLTIVVFTSSSEEEDMMKSFDLGANSYVRKPIDFEQFAEVTQKLGVYWFNLNEAAPTS